MEHSTSLSPGVRGDSDLAVGRTTDGDRPSDSNDGSDSRSDDQESRQPNESSLPQSRGSTSRRSSGQRNSTGGSQSSANTWSGLKINQTAFIHKLYSMLEDQSISHLISWTPTNDSFVISPGEEFSKVLSQYFKHTNVSSFVRQLNMYGFHKVNDTFHGASSGNGSSDNGIQWEFRHGAGSFKRGDVESLRAIKRRASRQNAGSMRDGVTVKSISLSVPSTPPPTSGKNSNAQQAAQGPSSAVTAAPASTAPSHQQHQHVHHTPGSVGQPASIHPTQAPSSQFSSGLGTPLPSMDPTSSQPPHNIIHSHQQYHSNQLATANGPPGAAGSTGTSPRGSGPIGHPSNGIRSPAVGQYHGSFSGGSDLENRVFRLEQTVWSLHDANNRLITRNASLTDSLRQTHGCIGQVVDYLINANTASVGSTGNTQSFPHLQDAGKVTTSSPLSRTEPPTELDRLKQSLQSMASQIAHLDESPVQPPSWFLPPTVGSSVQSYQQGSSGAPLPPPPPPHPVHHSSAPSTLVPTPPNRYPQPYQGQPISYGHFATKFDSARERAQSVYYDPLAPAPAPQPSHSAAPLPPPPPPASSSAPPGNPGLSQPSQPQHHLQQSTVAASGQPTTPSATGQTESQEPAEHARPTNFSGGTSPVPDSHFYSLQQRRHGSQPTSQLSQSYNPYDGHGHYVPSLPSRDQRPGSFPLLANSPYLNMPGTPASNGNTVVSQPPNGSIKSIKSEAFAGFRRHTSGDVYTPQSGNPSTPGNFVPPLPLQPLATSSIRQGSNSSMSSTSSKGSMTSTATSPGVSRSPPLKSRGIPHRPSAGSTVQSLLNPSNDETAGDRGSKRQRTDN